MLSELSNNLYVIESGEDSKTLSMLEKISTKMMDCALTRKSKIVAIGGGVVGDLAGFVAAVFMRGIEWINVPTSLLAQVDSGVGGKTAVNLNNYKNIIGAFHNPSDVYISLNFLETLPPREKLCGIGEIIKTAFLDKELFEYVSDNLSQLQNFDSETVEYCVKKCIDFKNKIVELDPHETSGKRKILNLGHTLGHALEKCDNHRLSHGEYVLHGLVLENYISKNYMNLEHYLHMNTILKKAIKGNKIKFDAKEVAHAAMQDKKNENGKISIIVAVDNGQQKEYMFLENDIFEGLSAWIKEYGQ